MASEDVLERAGRWMKSVSRLRTCDTYAPPLHLIRALAAEVRELRKDKARLDWVLERSVGYPVIAGRKTPAFDRDAIDAAMREEG